MAFRRVELPAAVPGTLWLSSMPGRWEPWFTFVDEARRVDLALTLCLTEPDEIAELSPSYRRAIDTGGVPGAWLNVPVRNYGVPDDAEDLRQAVEAVVQMLQQGGAVLLHCAAGMGRTGTAAACVLKRLGLPAQEALRHVRDAGSNPQSAVQSGLVNWF
ncbi:MAG TPA: dual specificity protein phosphatase family protein [Ideonella sp.]|uniref:protein-tyrosine phosphatase family protein n=1 Tax=Ideonella sp. TaxID=1929293 RepID=UPI002E36B721|nr:dual specificity protein phosphatase family protein [Ideonella sp.]HEX5686110.1 dual specificity protein phosphatase family protein [Ideonella sp.]